jgi:hypothetical protein
MTIRLHLQSIRVLGVVEDLPERLVVAVVEAAGWRRRSRAPRLGGLISLLGVDDRLRIAH